MNFHTLLFTSLCFYCGILKVSTEGICDKSKCPGPLQYYDEMKCQPVYKSPDDCCAYKYNCDRLKHRSPKKCYVNDHEYNIGETLRKEDSGSTCDFRCSCAENNDGISVVACLVSDYAYPPTPGPDCYYPRNAVDCGSVEPICPGKPANRPTCEVDGQIYKDGELFVPVSEPNKQCYCGSGYTGENVKPYCTEPMYGCTTELHNHAEIYKKCAPILSTSSLTSCISDFRCQFEDDIIIKAKDNDEAAAAAAKSDMTCQYGNLTMNYGDELNQTPFMLDCTKCVCEVGPAPTCYVIPNNQCKN